MASPLTSDTDTDRANQCVCAGHVHCAPLSDVARPYIPHDLKSREGARGVQCAPLHHDGMMDYGRNC